MLILFIQYKCLFLFFFKRSSCLRTQPSPPGPVPVPGGGVPLNMREVEELERMTKDFIKNMDAHAPVIASTPTGTCDTNSHVGVALRQDAHTLGHK